MENPFAQSNGNGSPLSKDQAIALLAATQDRKVLRSMLILGFYTGIALPELLKIEQKDINYHDCIITLTMPRRSLQLKESTIRPISEIQPKGQRLYDYSEKTIQRALNDLGIGTLGFNITWSSIRKTWAVFCFQKGIRIESMVRYSGSSVDALAKWAVLGKPGFELPADLLDLE